jgi:hypothetical protein
MEQLFWTRRQILKAAGAAGGLAAASSLLGPRIFLAGEERDSGELGRFGQWSDPVELTELGPTAADLAAGKTWNDFHPAISRDELTLYFTTTRYAPALLFPEHSARLTCRGRSWPPLVRTAAPHARRFR